MTSLLCKKRFVYKRSNIVRIIFEEGKYYDYWTNFNGLNHFVSAQPFHDNGTDSAYPFDGNPNRNRPYLYDYFYTEEQVKRDGKLNEILK